MRRVARAPLVHFLVLGALLLGARAWWEAGGGEGRRPRIVLTAADIARLRGEWAEEHGAPPDAAAEAVLVRRAVDEEVLWREALAAGIPERDPVTRERLVRLGEFLGEDGERGRQALEREARDLGLVRSDLVIRRHLVEAMQLALAKPAPADVPSDADLEAWVAAHAAELAEAPSVRLTHVYLSAEAHGAAIDADAARLLGELRRNGAGPEAADTRSDPFLRGAHLGPLPDDDLDRIFGPGFAGALDGAPLRTWVGPVRSSYGLHLVWIEERRPARVPSLAEVRSRAVLGVLRERGARRAEERMAQLRAAYDVRVERP
ncbi:MAG TPA: peptidylprolyl isomerase [Candidatus Binatia bacterium]|nr:peptidylprolyl isomerase [Candidatus Binatia bacterium]